jgi:hypothetical protein
MAVTFRVLAAAGGVFFILLGFAIYPHFEGRRRIFATIASWLVGIHLIRYAITGRLDANYFNPMNRV